MTEESTQALGGCQHREEQQHTHVWGYWADCFSLCSHIFTIILHRLKEGGREGGEQAQLSAQGRQEQTADDDV